MKSKIAYLAWCAFACGALAAEVGKPAPDFTARDINGQTHKLSDYKGKIVVLESYNQDCPFCHNHYQSGAMQELQHELTGKGVVWLLVNSVSPKYSSHRDAAAAKKEWAEQKIQAVALIFCSAHSFFAAAASRWLEYFGDTEFTSSHTTPLPVSSCCNSCIAPLW